MNAKMAVAKKCFTTSVPSHGAKKYLIWKNLMKPSSWNLITMMESTYLFFPWPTKIFSHQGMGGDLLHSDMITGHDERGGTWSYLVVKDEQPVTNLIKPIQS